MSKILVTYATFAGSTPEVAAVITQEIAKHHVEVDTFPLSEVKDLRAYDGVVLGAPMIMGWHRAALNFLKQHRPELEQIPLAIFVMAMSLTQTHERSVDSVPVYLDEHLPKAAKNEKSLSFRERYAQLANYLRPIIKAARPAKPVSIGLFAGRLDYGRLKWWAVLFAMVIVRAPAGDKRNWPAIRAWAAGLPAAFHLAPEERELFGEAG